MTMKKINQLQNLKRSGGENNKGYESKLVTNEKFLFYLQVGRELSPRAICKKKIFIKANGK